MNRRSFLQGLAALPLVGALNAHDAEAAPVVESDSEWTKVLYATHQMMRPIRHISGCGATMYLTDRVLADSDYFDYHALWTPNGRPVAGDDEAKCPICGVGDPGYLLDVAEGLKSPKPLAPLMWMYVDPLTVAPTYVGDQMVSVEPVAQERPPDRLRSAPVSAVAVRQLQTNV